VNEREKIRRETWSGGISRSVSWEFYVLEVIQNSLTVSYMYKFAVLRCEWFLLAGDEI
jgi:hypothetical protein